MSHGNQYFKILSAIAGGHVKTLVFCYLPQESLETFTYEIKTFPLSAASDQHRELNHGVLCHMHCTLTTQLPFPLDFHSFLILFSHIFFAFFSLSHSFLLLHLHFLIVSLSGLLVIEDFSDILFLVHAYIFPICHSLTDGLPYSLPHFWFFHFYFILLLFYHAKSSFIHPFFLLSVHFQAKGASPQDYDCWSSQTDHFYYIMPLLFTGCSILETLCQTKDKLNKYIFMLFWAFLFQFFFFLSTFSIFFTFLFFFVFYSFFFYFSFSFVFGFHYIFSLFWLIFFLSSCTFLFFYNYLSLSLFFSFHLSFSFVYIFMLLFCRSSPFGLYISPSFIFSFLNPFPFQSFKEFFSSSYLYIVNPIQFPRQALYPWQFSLHSLLDHIFMHCFFFFIFSLCFLLIFKIGKSHKSWEKAT